MLDILRSDRLRAALLNIPLLVLFICAWAADRWPEYSAAAISFAFLVVVAEVVFLYFLSRRRTAVAVPAVFDDSRDECTLDDLAVATALTKSPVTSFYVSTHSVYHSRARASEVRTWALATIPREERFLRAMTRDAVRHALVLPRIMEEWQVSAQGDDAFSIAAGAFEIEYFHGQTNIRVLDPGRVTVEGRVRGRGVEGVSAHIKPAIYQ
jgi:hypothetical protein